MEAKEKKQYTRVIHPFPPLYDSQSEILILGSLPSVKSREQMFFYGHKQNRFWKVMAAVLGVEVPQTIEEKKCMLHRHHIALWDTIYSCDIIGSSDSSIKNVVPTNLDKIIQESQVKRIFCNGTASERYFEKYQEKSLQMKAEVLPSTSPANAAYSLEKLIAVWSEKLKGGECL